MYAPSARAATPTPMPELAEPALTGQSAPKDAAVVIGVEDYTYVPDVPYARRDAEAFETFVRYTRGVPLERIRVLKDARAYEIEETLRAAGAQVGPGGTVWVYFAGHGSMDPNGSRRLLLGGDAATDPKAFARFAVAVDDVQTWATAGGGQAVLVIDACYNGGGRTPATDLTAGRRFAVPTYALAPGRTTTEWAATAPTELAAPLEPARHGAFTYFAVGALRGWADGELSGKRDGTVTADEAQAYVARALRTVQSDGQTPQLASADAASLVLARGVKERGPDLAAIRDATGSTGVEPAPRLDAVASLPTRPDAPAPPPPRSTGKPRSVQVTLHGVRGSDGTQLWVDDVCQEGCKARVQHGFRVPEGTHRVRIVETSSYDHDKVISGTLEIGAKTASKLVFNVDLEARPGSLEALTDARAWRTDSYVAGGVRHLPDGTPDHGWLGVTSGYCARFAGETIFMRQDYESDPTCGPTIQTVASAGPAEAAGLRPSDVLLYLGGARVYYPDDIGVALNDLASGTALDVVYLRQGTRYSTRAVLADWPRTSDAPSR